MDLKIFLKNLPAFEEFAAPHIETLANKLVIEDFADDDTLITQGGQGHALYLLLQGAVRLMRHDTPGGEEHEVRELNDGEMFGMLSLIDNLPASATCIAKGKVQAAALTREAFQSLFIDAPPVGRHLQYMVAVQMAREIQDENRRFRTSLVKA